MYAHVCVYVCARMLLRKAAKNSNVYMPFFLPQLSSHAFEKPACTQDVSWRAYLTPQEQSLAAWLKRHQPAVYNEAKIQFIEELLKLL